MCVVEVSRDAVGLLGPLPVFLAAAVLLVEVLMREVVAREATTHCSLGFPVPFSWSLLPDCQVGKLLECAL
jgi:hypothetical protein